MVITVRVVKGQVDLAYRALKRKLIESGTVSELRRRMAYEKPSDARAREAKVQQRRAEKRELSHNMRLIMQRRTRGF